MPYFHFVFALPPAIGAMAYQNKAKVYGLLFKAASETLITIAADQKHLGADIGIIAVLHTWGDNFQHHPHVHCVVPGGGVSADGKRWINCRPRFSSCACSFTSIPAPVPGGSDGGVQGSRPAILCRPRAPEFAAKVFAATLATLRTAEWLVYAKKTFAGPEQLLAYIAQYTHRVAITNNRLLDLDDTHVRFRWRSHK